MCQTLALRLFKGPLGLFACLLSLSLGAAAQSPAPEVLAASVPAPVRAPSPHSMYEGRPASVSINSVQIEGRPAESVPEILPWKQRITPVAIRYPGIDLASGLYQDMATEQQEPFIALIADKWMEKNAYCNNIFQKDRSAYPWAGPASDIMMQCRELNRPSQDLKPTCITPATALLNKGLVRLRWSCTLAPATQAFVYEETQFSPPDETFVQAINPASKDRSRIPIEPYAATNAVSP